MMSNEMPYKPNKLIKIVVSIALILLFFYGVVAFFSEKKSDQLPIPKVIVQKPVLKPMLSYITQTGTTVAYNSVNLVARVEGYLRSIEFTDGSFVNKGKELFVIQPDQYLEQLKSAQASLQIAKAESAYNKSEYARQQRMYQQNATSLNNVEKWLAKSHESDAAVDKSTADVALAEITYGYTHVAAPFDGRIGRHLVSVGNLVGKNEATNLATIEQIDKLYVYFNLNEIDLIRLRKAARLAGFKPEDLQTVPVDIALQEGDNNNRYKVTLDFVNTGLNASTGTMEVRAILDNKDLIFVPGLFVQVRMALGKAKPLLTIPDIAVLYDQIGAYVLTVNKDKLVELKRVLVGPKENETRGILSGLNASDQVIINGIQNATTGKPVDPITTSGVKQL